jgi:hypothetical protein
VSPEITNVPEMVPVALLRRYLTARGWRREDSPTEPVPPALSIAASADTDLRALFTGRSTGKPNVDVYVLSEAGLDDIELLVPQDRSGSDYERRLEGAIVTLSQVEDRKPEQVIEAVRSIGFDVVQSRIPDDLVIDDTIRLETAANYISGMKDLLAATATTEIRPLAFFGRLYKEATDYSDRCRFGHTRRGSFGFTIESPVKPDTEEVLFAMELPPPFERRVVQRLATGIQQVCEAVNRGDVQPIVDGFRSGFSANGCERFAKLVHDTAYSGMSFGFTFSPEWAVPEGLAKVAEFFVGPRHVEMARAAAVVLRGEALEIPTDVSGLVVRLQNEADPSDLSVIMGQGEISVLYSSENYGDIHVRITLPPAEYLKAVEAHRLGRPVRVSGILAHRGRYWYLSNPSMLTITYQPELGFE